MKKYFLAFLFLLSVQVIAGALGFLTSKAFADADHITVAFGPSVNGNTNPKMGAVGYEKVLGNLSLKAHGGAVFSAPWNAFIAAVVSARVETPSGLFMRTGVGPAWFAHTDERLSSRGEFNISTAVGLVQDGFAVGLEHDHFSNAGLVPPNLGSDHVCLVAEIKI